jgi:hypothetical protein
MSKAVEKRKSSIKKFVIIINIPENKTAKTREILLQINEENAFNIPTQKKRGKQKKHNIS